MNATRHEDFLPYNLPDISEAEIDAVVETLRSGWLAPGPRVKAFEEDFAAFVGHEARDRAGLGDGGHAPGADRDGHRPGR